MRSFHVLEMKSLCWMEGKVFQVDIPQVCATGYLYIMKKLPPNVYCRVESILLLFI